MKKKHKSADGVIRPDLPGMGFPGEGPEFDPHEPAFAPINFGSTAKDLIEAGDSAEGLLMRVVLKKDDPPDYRLVVRCLARYNRYNDKKHLDMLRALLAASVSIEGRGQLAYLMAKTGILATNVLERFIGGYLSNGNKNEKGKDYLVAPKRPKQEEEESDY